MRRFDKKKNMDRANQLAEQRYLKSKGLINEGVLNEEGGEVNFQLPSQLNDTLSQHFDNVSVSKSEITFKPSADTGDKPKVSYELILKLGDEDFQIWMSSGKENNISVRFNTTNDKLNKISRRLVLSLVDHVIKLIKNFLSTGKENVGKFTSGYGYEDSVTDDDLKFLYKNVENLNNSEMKLV